MDPVIVHVMWYCREGWPAKATPGANDQAQDCSVEQFRMLSVSLTTLLHGYTPSFQPHVLELLHVGHYGLQCMKQLASTAVYWSR